jgi:hypothetical protein
MRLKRFLIILLIAVLALALAVVVMAWQGNFLREKVVRPLSYVFWISSILLRGTPQALFWGILLLVTIVMASRSLFAPSQDEPRLHTAPGSSYHRSRLRYWLHQLLLNRYESARYQILEAVARLAMDVLSYQQGSTLQQFQRQIDPAKMEPEFLATLFQSRTPTYNRRSLWNLDELRQIVGRLWRALPFQKPLLNAQIPEIERTISYLEEQMDIE